MNSYKLERGSTSVNKFLCLKLKFATRSENSDLVKINKELDSFVYSVSHNIRGPIASLIGLLNLAKYEHASSTDNLSTIHIMMESRIKRLDATLKEILRYSQNARHEVRFERTEIIPLIKETFENLRYMNEFDKVEKQTLVRQNYVLNTDAHRVKIILNNLVSNVIKYRDPKKPGTKLVVKALIDCDRLQLVVEDNGIGIANEFLPRIFDMFFRATNIGEGDGLGLYIVKETVIRLRGEISIESEVGVGTKFIIELPNYQSATLNR